MSRRDLLLYVTGEFIEQVLVKSTLMNVFKISGCVIKKTLRARS